MTLRYLPWVISIALNITALARIEGITSARFKLGFRSCTKWLIFLCFDSYSFIISPEIYAITFVSFFETFKDYAQKKLVHIPKIDTQNFQERINIYLTKCENPIIILLDGLNEISNKEHKDEIQRGCPEC